MPMQWYDGKPYEEKHRRIKMAIEKAEAAGYQVSLIGESAGASAAMNTFARHTSLHRLISLCGVNNYNTPISPRIFKRGPAFKQSVELLSESQAMALATRAKRITSVTALYDSVVAVETNIIPGVRRKTIWSIGHLTTIILCLSVYSFVIVREIRRN